MVVEINHLQVREEFRGHGVSTGLIGAAERLATKAGRLHVGVCVASDTADGKRLYVRLGYRRTGIVDVSEYDWVTDAGAVEHAVETNELLVKTLDASGA